MDVMIDIETLGTKPNAIIVQLGAVMFDPHSGGKIHNDKCFNRYIKPDIRHGTIDSESISWWLQEKSASSFGEDLEQHGVHLIEALNDFEHWPKEKFDISWKDVNQVWAKPSAFDLPIIESAFGIFGSNPPWDHHKKRCVKTIFSITGTPKIDTTGFVKHNAVDDAVMQAMQLQKAIGVLNKS